MLSPGQQLTSGQSSKSPGGGYLLILQEDGNLCLHASGGGALWCSGTTNPGPVPQRAVMQTDGNLCLYAPGNVFVWCSGTVSPGARLVFGEDGRIAIVAAAGSAIWSRP